MAEVRNALTSGVLDPLLKDRHDLKQYNAGLETGINIEFLPQGGVRNRAGHSHKHIFRNTLESLLVNTPALTATPTTLPAVFAEFDQGLPQSVACFDVFGIYAAPEEAGENETYDDTINLSEETDEQKELREAALEAKKARLIRNGKPVCQFKVYYSLDGNIWRRIGGAHDVTRKPRSRRFALPTGSVDAKHWRITLFDFVEGSDPLGLVTIEGLKLYAETDTESPVRLINNGIFELAITDKNIDVFENGVWQTSMPGDATADQLTMVTYTQEAATVLLFHPDIRPVRLKRQGRADSWNHDFPILENVPDDVMDANLGWPRCGTFYQSRLILAGFKSAPDVILFSVNGDIFNFNKGEGDLATDAMQYRVDAGFPQIIHRIFVGRHLQFFTDQAEWFIEARTVDATKPLNVVLATRHGIRAVAGVHFIEGSTVFVQKTGTVLRDFLFSDAELSYKAEAITLLASHLLTDVVDIAVRRAAETSEGNLVFLINADGTMTLLTLLRSQSVVAAAQCITDGDYLAADVDDNDRVWLAVRRNGRICLEQWDNDYLLDGAIKSTSLNPRQIISGLEVLEGKSVWAVADGNPYGPDIVRDGRIILDGFAKTVEVGLLPELTIKPLALVRRTRDGAVLRRKSRIHTVWLSLMNTGDLSLAANDGPARPVPLRQFGEKVLDTPMMDDLFTGEKVLYNRKGCGYHPTIELTRTVPAPVLVRSIIMES